MARSPAQPAVLIRSHPDHLDVTCEGRLLVRQQLGGPRPYLHPVHPRDGRGVLTEDAPPHHPWQHGIYTGFHGVGGSDFWFDHGQRPEAGRITLDACEPVPASAPDQAGWSLRALWCHHQDDRPLLAETQAWTLRLVEQTWALDLAWTLEGREDLAIEQHAYGGLFVRMPFRAACGARVLNAAGQTDDACEQARARWLWLSMAVEGRDEPAGFLLCDHPGNPGHPAVWRVDGQRGVGPSLVSAGPLRLSPGQPRTWRFRLLAAIGAPEASWAEAQFQRYVEESGR